MTRLEKLDHLEKRIEEVKRKEMEFVAIKGAVDEEIKTFLRTEGVPENFDLITLIKTFTPKSVIEVV